LIRWFSNEKVWFRNIRQLSIQIAWTYAIKKAIQFTYNLCTITIYVHLRKDTIELIEQKSHIMENVWKNFKLVHFKTDYRAAYISLRMCLLIKLIVQSYLHGKNEIDSL
jgi:hypothetical protein